MLRLGVRQADHEPVFAGGQARGQAQRVVAADRRIAGLPIRGRPSALVYQQLLAAPCLAQMAAEAKRTCNAGLDLAVLPENAITACSGEPVSWVIESTAQPGTPGEDAILMVEAGATEVHEEVILQALQAGHEAMQDVISILSTWQAELVRSGSSLVDRPGVLHSFSADWETAVSSLSPATTKERRYQAVPLV